MTLIIKNLTFNDLSYLNGAVVVSALSSTTVSSTLIFPISRAAGLIFDVKNNQVILNDGTNDYQDDDALNYLDKIATSIGGAVVGLIGSPTPSYGILVAGKDPNGNVSFGEMDLSGALYVVNKAQPISSFITLQKITKIQSLLNSNSKAMNVNGSVTPVMFNFVADAATLIKRISFILNSSGTTSFSNFGTRASLSNGLLIESVINNSNYQIANIKDNADIMSVFANSISFGNGATDTLGSPSGFGNSVDFVVGSILFTNETYPMVLNTNDSIQVTVRDDLSSIGSLQMMVEYIQEI